MTIFKTLITFFVGGGVVASAFIPTSTEGMQPNIIHQAGDTVKVEQVNFEELGLTEKTELLRDYLELKGEDFTNTNIWLEIARDESKKTVNGETTFYNLHIEPITYVHTCDKSVQVNLWGYKQPPSNIVEVHDKAEGVYQATCEDYGAVTISKEKSYGLFQILPSSARDANCSSDWKETYTGQVDCAIKLRDWRGEHISTDETGYEGWSTFYKVNKYYQLPM